MWPCEGAEVAELGQRGVTPGDVGAPRSGSVAGEDPGAGDPERGGRDQSGRDGDQVVGIGAAQGPAQVAETEAGVGDHDGRADPPAGVHGDRQIDTGPDEERDPLSRPHPGPLEPDRQLRDPSFEIGEADRRGGVRPELGDRDLVVVGPGEQPVPERSIGVAGVGGGESRVGRRRRSAARRPPRPAPTPRRPSPPEVRPPPPGARPAGRAGRPLGGAGDAGRAGSGSRRPDPAGPRPAARADRRDRLDRRPRRPGWRGSGGRTPAGCRRRSHGRRAGGPGSRTGSRMRPGRPSAGPVGTARWWRGRTPASVRRSSPAGDRTGRG